MPYLRLETNVPQRDIPKDLSKKLCHVLSKILGKPLSYCVATVIGDVDMSWGGSADPAAQATLMSIGALGFEANKKHSKAIADVVETELKVPADRMYITFGNVPSADVGYNGTTFHEILG